MTKYHNQIIECEIEGKPYRFKSKLEYRYALYLQWLKSIKQIQSWEYEPRTFEFPIKHGTTNYTPDFMTYEINGREHTILWHECKGYLTPKAATQIKRFKKYFPDENLLIIDSNWMKKNSPKLRKMVPGWI